MNILLYSVLVFTIHGKILKIHIRITSIKYRLQHEMNNLNYLDSFEDILKKHGEKQFILP